MSVMKCCKELFAYRNTVQFTVVTFNDYIANEGKFGGNLGRILMNLFGFLKYSLFFKNLEKLLSIEKSQRSTRMQFVGGIGCYCYC